MPCQPPVETPTTDGLSYLAASESHLEPRWVPAAPYPSFPAQPNPSSYNDVVWPSNEQGAIYYNTHGGEGARPVWDYGVEQQWLGTLTSVPLQASQPELQQPQPHDIVAPPQPRRWQYPVASHHLPPRLATQSQLLYAGDGSDLAGSPPISTQFRHQGLGDAEHTYSLRFPVGHVVESPHLGMSPTVTPVQGHSFIPTAPISLMQPPAGGTTWRTSELSLQYNDPDYLQHLLHAAQPEANVLTSTAQVLQTSNPGQLPMYYEELGLQVQSQQQWASLTPTVYQPLMWPPATFPMSRTSNTRLSPSPNLDSTRTDENLRIVIPSPPASNFASPTPHTIESHNCHSQRPSPKFTYTPTPYSPASAPHSPALAFSPSSSSFAGPNLMAAAPQTSQPSQPPNPRQRFPCPRPGCTKHFSNRNGLRYHLQRGTCEHNPLLIPKLAPFSPLPSSPLAAPATTAPTTPMALLATAMITKPKTTNSSSTSSTPSTDPAAANIKVTRRPYWCRICGEQNKSYKNLNGLKYHARTMHPGVPFEEQVKAAFFGHRA
ncbi:hypothetical protein HDU86_003671 [Geranomyces michiganensis]|nr:hypothetical protein HDU86_003671 [Geranomyces michiganensis]